MIERLLDVAAVEALPVPIVLDRVCRRMMTGSRRPASSVLKDIPAELSCEVWVVAPEHDQSGASHAISLHHPILSSSKPPRRLGDQLYAGDCAAMGVAT